MTLLYAILGLVLALAPYSARADYKPEFTLSVNVSADTSWGRAAARFATAVKFRTRERIRIKTFFNGELFSGRQTSEFELLQLGIADFAVGSTINWSPQIPQLNLFSLPFLFSSHAEVDAVESGEPGARLLKLIEDKGVLPLAWGENGFRELTNSARPIRRPDDFTGLSIRVVGIPIFVESLRAMGANPVTMNWDAAQIAFHDGAVDGQENPIGLIVPYRLWVAQKHITLWHHAIDPLILAVSAKTWASLKPQDQYVLQRVAEEVMAEQKKEAREGSEHAETVGDRLEMIYGMEAVRLTPVEREAFRSKTRDVYTRWSEVIGLELVRKAEALVAGLK